MKVNHHIEIIDGKIKSNKVRYDLGREAAKIFALSSKDLSLLTFTHFGSFN